jgi:hypothetical protein
MNLTPKQKLYCNLIQNYLDKKGKKSARVPWTIFDCVHGRKNREENFRKTFSIDRRIVNALFRKKILVKKKNGKVFIDWAVDLH